MKQYLYKTFLVCLLACIGQSVWAYDFTAKSDDEFDTDLYFTINADGATVTLTKGENSYSAKSITIPGTVDYDGKTYTVTTIGSYAFNGTYVVTIVMPNTITEVQSYAFKSSTVANVTFSNKLKYIRDEAFNCTKLAKVELYEGLESIGDGAFSGNYEARKREINTLILPNSLKEIGENAFSYQDNLTEVDLPNNLEVLEDKVFYGCSSLATVKLPDGLKSIGSYAFYYCAMESITFPTSLETIEDHAFQYTKLKEVDLPDNITSIGTNCFEYCNNLQSIRFSVGLTELPNYVCDGDEILTQLTIPEGITTIGYGAFMDCEILSNVTLPESITEIGSLAFSNTGIAVFNFPTKVSSLPYGLFNNCKNIQEMSIPETVTSLGSGTFEGCENLQKVSLPNSLTYIGERTFYGCKLLTEIDIPASVTEIGESCFGNCEKLATIDIKKGLKVIGEEAFWCCTALKEISFPSTLTSIGQFPFWETPNMQTIHMSRAIPPTATGPSTNQALFNSDNECTLYVPTGCKDLYEANSYWNAKYIEEEDVDGELEYQISATVNNYGAGKLVVSSEDGQLSNTAVVKRNTKLVVEIVPSEGYHFVSLVYNNKDVTSQVVDNTYTIDAVDGNITLNATFAENPYTLYLKSSEQGTIGVPVERGKSITCDIAAAEGWKINSVHFGYSDVTDLLAEDGTITVTPSYDGETLSVSFEQSSSIGSIAGTESNAKAHVTQDGTLYVENVTDGSDITIYCSDGKVAGTMKARAGCATTRLSANGIYIVKVQGKSIKVIY